MSRIVLIKGGNLSNELQGMIDYALKGHPFEIIENAEDIGCLNNCKILFACELDGAGFDIPLFKILSKLQTHGYKALAGCTGAVFIHSPGELYSKSVAQRIIFLANQLGCSFIGHPVVEAIEGYKNFSTWQKVINLELKEICLENSKKLIDRLVKEEESSIKSKLLVLHASHRKTSNTLMLWEKVESYLSGFEIKTLNVENGEIIDCIGCSFKTCLHYSQQSSCFYGGVVVKEVYPAIEEADTILWISPNYNDTLSANLTAVINRLTALYRKISFYDKSIYSIIVSGNSGSDSVATQLIGALNINKGFKLPPYFSLMAIANEPRSILNIEGIDEKAKEFARRIMGK